MAFSTHYCRGKKVSVVFFKEAESCCGNANCCHTENSFVKVKDDFAVSPVSEIPLLAETIILGTSLPEDIQINTPETKIVSFLTTDSPPPIPLQTSLSLKQVYLL